ncbi:DUF1800 domain-containing protein [Deinococcus yavapaiensis]|uniref:Uncharacterized protein (DUF1800 family) n=1 Tax=Deinococcus yavapaiensis KR-236 TaxID=694435 RepID=A0A318S0K3_9DEIO|nr:DUF1800 domain-containing protein [Deinococcus yavapaiensis]PYE48942.1 uncharacterized protein (DUF1800 family) [Deinococcus yavapaiensis KR-236]
MTLSPYRPRTFSLEDAAHLLRRAAFGATAALTREFAALGPQKAVERLLNFDTTELPDNPFDPAEGVNGGAAVRLAQMRWLHELMYSPHPLREKLALTWSNHFVIGVDKVRQAGMLKGYMRVLREHGLSKFERLTLEVSKTPAMLLYLDNNQNKKGKPNENFSRELLELFTTGIGHYTEEDVKEGARAFTGWAFRGLLGLNNPAQTAVPEFVFQSNQHDRGRKTYLGQSGNLTGEDVIRIATHHPATADFVGRKLWRAFVSDTPSDAGVRELVQLWNDTDGDLRAILTALLTSETFYAPENRHAIIKSPVEYVVGTVRALGQPKLKDEKRYTQVVQQMAKMGQALLGPPTVEGWKGGRDWISDTALLTRMQTAASFALGSTLSKDVKAADLPLALLGRERAPFEAALRGLGVPQQAYLTLISPEYALA